MICWWLTQVGKVIFPVDSLIVVIQTAELLPRLQMESIILECILLGTLFMVNNWPSITAQWLNQTMNIPIQSACAEWNDVEVFICSYQIPKCLIIWWTTKIVSSQETQLLLKLLMNPHKFSIECSKNIILKKDSYKILLNG